MSTRRNIIAIARREYLVRIRTRSFMVATALLVLGVVVIAMLPVIVSQVDRTSSTKVAVVAPDSTLATRASTTISTLLNATATTGQPAASTTPDFVVTAVPNLDAARRDVGAGTYSAVLGIARTAAGDLAFTLYTDDPATGRNASLLQQAANALAVEDRLDRLGVAPTDRTALFAPATFAVAWPDPANTDPIRDTASAVGQDMLSFGMTILIFMIIIMYGNWIAMSVVEEKSSRVMEVVLNAATPLQLLAGKVFGVGAVAFTQYAAVVAAGVVGLLAQGPIASLVLGGSSSAVTMPGGLTPGLLLMFGAYGILGFLLYATLYAAAGSLVSRQEDVNSAVMPMTLISMAGYMVGVYASMGLLDARSGWITVLTQIPFLSPFMMLGRAAAGFAEPWEIILSLTTLTITIAAAMWLAARVYAVGVLLYGQRPGARVVWRLLREGM